QVMPQVPLGVSASARRRIRTWRGTASRGYVGWSALARRPRGCGGTGRSQPAKVRGQCHAHRRAERRSDTRAYDPRGGERTREGPPNWSGKVHVNRFGKPVSAKGLAGG